MKIRKSHATLALEVQSAVNLKAIVKNFSKVLDEIWEDYKGEVEEYGSLPLPWHPNNHPVTILFAEQIKHLTSPLILNNGELDYHQAYQLILKANEEGVE